MAITIVSCFVKRQVAGLTAPGHSHRVLLAKPRLVLMDESTSALDTDNEAHLYRCLQREDIGYVSVGHRPTLMEFHTRVLRLTPRNSQREGVPKSEWEVDGVEYFRAAEPAQSY